jgi:hypothetical protein
MSWSENETLGGKEDTANRSHSYSSSVSLLSQVDFAAVSTPGTVARVRLDHSFGKLLRAAPWMQALKYDLFMVPFSA